MESFKNLHFFFNSNTQVEQRGLVLTLGTLIDFCDVSKPESGGCWTMKANTRVHKEGAGLIPLIGRN